MTAADRMGVDDPRRVEAAPEKLFFVSMIVKDIELIPAIIDLVDNSADGARKLRSDGDYSGLTVKLMIDPANDRFEIADNCGGFDADIARHYAFRFGRPENFVGIEGSVGQFGVGMKRAIFKLGKAFRVESRAEQSRFVIDEQVDRWADDHNPDWSFRFDELDEPWSPPDHAELGTTIGVTQLHDGVKRDLSLTQNVGRLRTDLQLRHQEALLAGLTIEINGELLVASTPALVYSDLIKPIKRAFTIPAEGDRSVEATLVAGIVHGRADDRDRDDGDAEDAPRSAEAGWYLFCNGRLVLVADKTRLTGWGVAGNNAYHPQYRLFRGYAYLRARDSSLLPWNTTKTGVDEDSSVFRTLQAQMEVALKEVQQLLNDMKKERQYNEEGTNRPLNTAVAAAAETSVAALPVSERVEAPAAAPRPPAGRNQMISYSVDRDAFEAARTTLGVNTPRDVGLETFTYYYEAEV
jgi:hypothetical protein